MFGRQTPNAPTKAQPRTACEDRPQRGGPGIDASWTPTASSPAWEFSAIPILSPAQADRLDGEAENIATQLTRTPAPQIAARVSRLPANPSPERGGTVPRIVDEIVRSPGQPLDADTRAHFEPLFGRDLSAVRVHADGRAAEGAQGVRAHAFTVGNAIVFAQGKYDPAAAPGRRLLAHELTHTIQQSAGAARALQCQPDGSDHGSGGATSPRDSAPIQSYVFGGDKRLGTDVGFAQRAGVEMAARLRARGHLSPDDRLELNGMLSFFNAAAKDVYIQNVKPALLAVLASAPVRANAPTVSPAANPQTDAPQPAAGAAEMHIGDTDVAIALDKAARGAELQPMEAEIVHTIHAEGTEIKIVHNTEFELQEGGGTGAGFEVVGRPPAPSDRLHRDAILATLDAANVGGARGTKDQLIVRQALLTDAPPGTAKIFRAADGQFIRGLARLAHPPIPVDDLGGYANVTEYLQYERGTNRFTIEVQGRSLIIQPIEHVRPDLKVKPGGQKPAKQKRSKLTKAEKKRIVEKNDPSAEPQDATPTENSGELSAEPAERLGEPGRAAPGPFEPLGKMFFWVSFFDTLLRSGISAQMLIDLGKGYAASVGAEALLGEAAGPFVLFSGLVSDNAKYAAEQEKRDALEALNEKIDEKVSNYVDSHPGEKNVREKIIRGMLATQQREKDKESIAKAARREAEAEWLRDHPPSHYGHSF